MITQEDIYKLPIHDSDFLSLSFTQKDNGEFNIALNVILYEGEYNDIDEYKEYIKNNGEIKLIFKDCLFVKFNSYDGIKQRDSIDFIEINNDNYNFDKKIYISIRMNSGSKITFNASSAELERI